MFYIKTHSLGYNIGRPRWLIRPVVARNADLLGSNPGRWDFHHRVCAYTVLQTVQRAGVCSAVRGAVHRLAAQS